jgi:large subunit ribosomal protein L25
MDQEAISAQRRTETGTIVTRRMRRDGRVPAILYGHKEETVPVSLPGDEVDHLVAHHLKMVTLQLDGQTEQALVKEVQFDTLGDNVLHLDLERVRMDEVIEVECAIELTGTAKGAAAGGVMDNPLNDVTVRCTPANIPESIRVSVNDLEIGDSLTVADLEVPDGTEIVTDPESVVVIIHPPALVEEEEEEEVEPGLEEPEVIGRKADEEEEETEETS